MVEEAGKASGIEKFDGTDFAYWRMQIEDYLYGRKLHLPLLGTKPENMKVEEWALLDRQVLGVIRLTLSRSVAHNVVKGEDHSRFDEGFVRWEAMRDGSKQFYGKGKAQTRGRGNNRNSKQGRSNSRNSNRNRSKSRSSQQVQCWNCGKTGHFKRQCKSLKKKNEDDSANAVTEEVQDALLLVVDSPLDDWVLDSGALFHTTPHREIIQNYVVGDFGKVYLVDGSALDVVGLGDVRISLPNGSVWLLEKVRHIPDLRRNLISVGQLDDEGHAILFVGGTWKVTKGAKVLARGKKTGTLLGHMSEKGMKMLLSKGKLPELKSIDFDMCESCILGKQKKVSFLKTGRTPKAENLELVHTDLWGPSPVASLGGSRYYITFIDDSSRKDTTVEWCGSAHEQNSHERARSMRLHAGLPKTFWTDAVSTVAYLINRGPSVPMEFRLPEEVWSGKEVKFSHLKVFGCISYVHIDSDARSKLDAKSKICFFIGYGDEKFGYRSSVVSDVTEIDQKKSEFVNLDELTESTVQKGGEEDKENVNSQPECYDEALQDENSSKWELVMKDEMDSLLGNQTWELTELPVRKKALHNKWKEGIDYTEIFSPAVKMSTIRLVLGMVAAENLHLEQLDVKTAFLHGDLEEDLYMIQPEGFIVQGQENLVCKLRKSLYGLKQAPRQWYKKFDNFMHRIGFKRCEADHCCYVKSFDNSYIILLLYVDDMLIDKANGTLKLSQSEYVKKVLSRFNMNEAKPVSTPLGSHFKLSQTLHMQWEFVSRFMSRPGKQHWEAVKWILRYLKGSLDTCLCFTGASLKLQGYVDADFAGDIDSRKSTTGFVFTLGGTAISWASNLQKIVTLSTTKAEYVAATEAGKEMIWLHGFLDELGKKQEMGILHSDSQSAIFLGQNSAFHSKSKHIQTNTTLSVILLKIKLVIPKKICGSKNPADMLTKGVTIEKLKLCSASIGLLA
ncbi:Retrovirus-related Pol polyprotein from transposon TNT 1-94 [Vitis vinifera]|uniref:Retrovirus-related Pol polyprotein from transposon TNT 1-94 n=1 Tax=Vitis vinifera TaxID=29760 RepID=A0A438HWU7_VITVI|nr:Retrovirus-related Pol polyprotein from transposon TNT 1-94 [Vitis vinifera]